MLFRIRFKAVSRILSSLDFCSPTSSRKVHVVGFRIEPLVVTHLGLKKIEFRPISNCMFFSTKKKSNSTHISAGCFCLIKCSACFEASATFSACCGSNRRSTDILDEDGAGAGVGCTEMPAASLDAMMPEAFTAGLMPLARPSSSLITREGGREIWQFTS